MSTIWETIIETLLDNGIEAYPPAMKVGECKRKYVVVKSDGASQFQNYSTEVNYYTLLLYVPQLQYAQLERFKTEVKEVVANNLFPLLMPTGQETPDYYDDTFKAHMISVQYRINKGNKQL